MLELHAAEREGGETEGARDHTEGEEAERGGETEGGGGEVDKGQAERGEAEAAEGGQNNARHGTAGALMERVR